MADIIIPEFKDPSELPSFVSDALNMYILHCFLVGFALVIYL